MVSGLFATLFYPDDAFRRYANEIRRQPSKEEVLSRLDELITTTVGEHKTRIEMIAYEVREDAISPHEYEIAIKRAYKARNEYLSA